MRAKINSILVELSVEEANYLTRLTFTDWIGKLTPNESEKEKDRCIREEIHEGITKVLKEGKY